MVGILLTSSADISLTSFGNASRTHQKLGFVTVEIQTLSGELIPISVLAVPTIAAPIQNIVSHFVNSMPHLQELKLAHPVTSNKNFAISLLIGADYYCSGHHNQRRWAHSSGVKTWLSTIRTITTFSLTVSSLYFTTDNILSGTWRTQPRKVWSVESIGTNTHTTSINLSFLRTYRQSSITKTPEGVYIARFPWKEDKPYLPSNFKENNNCLS